MKMFSFASERSLSFQDEECSYTVFKLFFNGKQAYIYFVEENGLFSTTFSCDIKERLLLDYGNSAIYFFEQFDEQNLICLNEVFFKALASKSPSLLEKIVVQFFTFLQKAFNKICQTSVSSDNTVYIFRALKEMSEIYFYFCKEYVNFDVEKMLIGNNRLVKKPEPSKISLEEPLSVWLK